MQMGESRRTNEVKGPQRKVRIVWAQSEIPPIQNVLPLNICVVKPLNTTSLS